MSDYVNPWTNPQHDDWVAAGHCPSIHSSKAWCNSRSSDDHKHFAPRIPPPGEKPQPALTWTDAAEHPRPPASPSPDKEESNQ